jgi:hypothetical protein
MYDCGYATMDILPWYTGSPDDGNSSRHLQYEIFVEAFPFTPLELYCSLDFLLLRIRGPPVVELLEASRGDWVWLSWLAGRLVELLGCRGFVGDEIELMMGLD